MMSKVYPCLFRWGKINLKNIVSPRVLIGGGGVNCSPVKILLSTIQTVASVLSYPTCGIDKGHLIHIQLHILKVYVGWL